MDSSSIITSVLHLKEASDLLLKDEPEISYTLLQLSKVILDSHSITNEQVEEAKNIASEISGNLNTENNQ